jgi:cancer susceptibility candidate protein 1
MTDPDLKSAVD